MNCRGTKADNTFAGNTFRVRSAMENQTSPISSEPLQFDRLVADDSISAGLRDQVAARCVVCGTAINTEYYQVCR
jgi:hypothetical protein